MWLKAAKTAFSRSVGLHHNHGRHREDVPEDQDGSCTAEPENKTWHKSVQEAGSGEAVDIGPVQCAGKSGFGQSGRGVFDCNPLWQPPSI
jgi:hypothetical protein